MTAGEKAFLVILLVFLALVLGAGAILLLTGFLSTLSGQPPEFVVFFLILSGLAAFLLIRFGLVCLVAAFAFLNVLDNFPLTTQGFAWYAGISLAGILLMAAIAAPPHRYTERHLRKLQASHEFKRFAVGTYRPHYELLNRLAAFGNQMELRRLRRSGRERSLKSRGLPATGCPGIRKSPS